MDSCRPGTDGRATTRRPTRTPASAFRLADFAALQARLQPLPAYVGSSGRLRRVEPGEAGECTGTLGANSRVRPSRGSARPAGTARRCMGAERRAVGGLARARLSDVGLRADVARRGRRVRSPFRVGLGM